MLLDTTYLTHRLQQDAVEVEDILEAQKAVTLLLKEIESAYTRARLLDLNNRVRIDDLLENMRKQLKPGGNPCPVRDHHGKLPTVRGKGQAETLRYYGAARKNLIKKIERFNKACYKNLVPTLTVRLEGMEE